MKPPMPRPEEPDGALAAVGSVVVAAGMASGGGIVAASARVPREHKLPGVHALEGVSSGRSGALMIRRTRDTRKSKVNRHAQPTADTGEVEEQSHGKSQVVKLGYQLSVVCTQSATAADL